MPPKLMSPRTHSSAIGKEAINKITPNSQEGDECSGGSRSSRAVLGGGCAPVSHKRVLHELVCVETWRRWAIGLGESWGRRLNSKSSLRDWPLLLCYRGEENKAGVARDSVKAFTAVPCVTCWATGHFLMSRGAVTWNLKEKLCLQHWS